MNGPRPIETSRRALRDKSRLRRGARARSIRLHSVDCDDLGTVEVPAGYLLRRGDLLVDRNSRLVRVVEFVPSPPGSIAALVKVVPAREVAR